jgi:hypothetical protein
MRKTIAILAVLAMGLPALSLAWMPDAGAFPLPPLTLPHSGSVIIDNFTGTQMTNLSLNDTGAAGLDESSRFWGTMLQASPINHAWLVGALAGGTGGRFVAAWLEAVEVNHTSYEYVYAQLFDVQGNKVGNFIPVATSNEFRWDVTTAMGAGGDFLVAWTENGGFGSIFAQRYDRDGNKVGTTLNVTYDPQYKGYIVAAANSKGDYIVVWRDNRDGKAHIRGRMISKTGTFLTDDILVSGGTENHDYPCVAFDSHDRAIVAFTSATNKIYVLVQRLDDKGQKVGLPLGPGLGANNRYSPRICTDPWDNFVLSWTEWKDNSTRYNIFGQKYDPSGAPVGGEMTLVGDAGDQELAYTGYDPDGNMLVTWTDNRTGNNETYAKILYRTGVTRPVSTDISGSQSTQDYVSGMVATPDGDFMVMWTGINHVGSDYSYRLVARPLRTSHLLSGTLVTAPLMPDNIWRWSTLTPDIKFSNPSTNSVTFQYSADDGANWTAVPSSGDISAAGRSSIRIKAIFSTIDNLTTPVLWRLTAKYIKNTAPSVTVSGAATVKKGQNVTISSNVSDPDFLDVFGVTYKWTQTAGKNLTIANTTGQNLSFKADRAGTFTFSLFVSDGYNESAPATITVKVTETKTPAKSGFEWVAVLGTAMALAVFIKRRTRGAGRRE